MNTLRFDYEIYYYDNCVWPVLFVLFGTVIATVGVISIMREWKRAGYKDKKLPSSLIAKSVMAFCVMAIILSAAIIPLARGGIFLLFEKDSNAIDITGEIQEVFEIPSFGGMKYRVDQNNGKGEGIILDGNKYYLMTYGDFKKGDVVTIRVLPKSKLVLEISGS